MDTSVSTPQAVATVISVEGQAFARDPAGQMRALKPGDILREGDTIVTMPGGQVQLAFLEGHMLSLLPNETFQFSAETSPTSRPDVAEASLPAGEADRIIQALERGENIDDLLDPTAAGLDGGGNNAGNDFVRLLRIVEEVSSQGFLFGNGASRAGLSQQDDNDALAGLAASNTFNFTPVASDIVVAGQEDAASISLTLSASDIDGSIDSYTVATLPRNGTLYSDAELSLVIVAGSNIAGSTVYFVPDANWNGSAGFSYTSTDNLGRVSNSATATFNVSAVNDAAAISGDSAAALTESNVAQSTGGTLAATDVDSANSFVAQTNVAGSNGYGVFSIGTDGVWTYAMNAAHDAFVAGTDYTDSFTVATADGTSQRVTVTISGTNDAAAISGDSAAALTESNVAQSTGGTLAATD
ncbi:MAG: retention module-containing protein, partial [Thiobacillus sp.]|nr:retention module-containing protein [Thiobacillus sp.]